MDIAAIKPNYEAISYEDFGEEVVIVKLDSGVYYSLNLTAVAVWRLLEQQASVEDITASLLAQYNSDATTVQQALAAFLQDLQTEELVVINTAPCDLQLDGGLTNQSPPKSSFISPALHRYTDMQDLLLLDPIHEVDEAGWPIAITPMD